MILRLSDSLSRGLLVAAALLVGLWLSFFSIRAAFARHYTEGDTATQLEMAVRLEPNNADYLYNLGRFQQYNLEKPDAALAELTYRTVIALNPVATDAWLDLGTAYELDGKTESARQAYLQAQNSYPTSADVAWRYGNFLLRQGEQADAYAQLRRAIAADPQRAAAAYSRAYRSNPDVDQLLAELFPPNQTVYINVISEALGAQQLAVAKTLWAHLLTLHPHLQLRDFDPLVSDLLSAHEFTEARQVWDQGTSTMNLPPLLQLKSSVVWDPSFETDLNGSYFSWQYPQIIQGVSITLDKSEKLSGAQSLRLSFDGKHDPNLETPCTQAVVQPDTTYRFSGWIRTDRLVSDQGVAFRIRAIDQHPPVGVSTKQVLGTNPWGFVDQTWTAGPQIHQVQICVVRAPSENRALRISGTAWIDDVNLLPQPTEHPKP